MKNELKHYILLAKRLALSLGIFMLCRLVFLSYNFHYFKSYTAITIATTFFYGLRFDISTVLLVNLILVIFHILPTNLRNTRSYQKGLLILFVIFNTIALTFEMGDTANYKFAHKRLTTEFFGVLGDFNDQLWSYLTTFWYFIAICIGVIWIIARLYLYFTKMQEQEPQKTKVQILLFIPALLLVWVGLRGGIGSPQISPVTALEYVEPPLSPLVYNTCFSLGASVENRILKDPEYFDHLEEQSRYFSMDRDYFNQSLPQKKLNVVVIILESFSRYFVESLAHDQVKCTPFLDSLIESGSCYVATNGFANARHSHEGNTAILTSVPSLMIDPFMTSVYQGNEINSFAKILKGFGYQTAYFHGAKNGSMKLDEFTQKCGFDRYYGKNEFNDPTGFDGNWGIYDSRFFPFVADCMDSLKEPFVASVFNLSTHFPYIMPQEYRNKYPNEAGVDPEIPMIRYTDEVLRDFFKRIQKSAYYNQTLFVISADHTYDELSKNGSYLSKFSIPILFYCPSDTGVKTNFSFPVQQVDIMPSILQYLNVPVKFKSFGYSVFDPTAHRYAYNFEQGLYQITGHDAMLQFDGRKAIGFFDLKTDPFQRHNLIALNDPRKDQLTKEIMAIIQTHNQAMMYNKLK